MNMLFRTRILFPVLVLICCVQVRADEAQQLAEKLLQATVHLVAPLNAELGADVQQLVGGTTPTTEQLSAAAAKDEREAAQWRVRLVSAEELTRASEENPLLTPNAYVLVGRQNGEVTVCLSRESVEALKNTPAASAEGKTLATEMRNTMLAVVAQAGLLSSNEMLFWAPEEKTGVVRVYSPSPRSNVNYLTAAGMAAFYSARCGGAQGDGADYLKCAAQRDARWQTAAEEFAAHYPTDMARLAMMAIWENMWADHFILEIMLNEANKQGGASSQEELQQIRSLQNTLADRIRSAKEKGWLTEEMADYFSRKYSLNQQQSGEEEKTAQKEETGGQEPELMEPTEEQMKESLTLTRDYIRLERDGAFNTSPSSLDSNLRKRLADYYAQMLNRHQKNMVESLKLLSYYALRLKDLEEGAELTKEQATNLALYIRALQRVEFEIRLEMLLQSRYKSASSSADEYYESPDYTRLMRCLCANIGIMRNATFPGLLIARIPWREKKMLSPDCYGMAVVGCQMTRDPVAKQYMHEEISEEELLKL